MGKILHGGWLNLLCTAPSAEIPSAAFCLICSGQDFGKSTRIADSHTFQAARATASVNNNRMLMPWQIHSADNVV